MCIFDVYGPWCVFLNKRIVFVLGETETQGRHSSDRTISPMFFMVALMHILSPFC